MTHLAEVQDVRDVHAIGRDDLDKDFVWEGEQTAAIVGHKRVTEKGVTGSSMLASERMKEEETVEERVRRCTMQCYDSRYAGTAASAQLCMLRRWRATMGRQRAVTSMRHQGAFVSLA